MLLKMRPLTFVLLLIIFAFCAAVNPGIKVRVTKRGLDYGKRVADYEIASRLRNLRLRDLNGRSGRYRYTIQRMKFSLGGSIDFKFSRVDVTENTVFSTRATGSPSIYSSGCSAWIGDLDLRSVICRAVERYINVHADEKLGNIKMTTEVANNFLLDYSLVSKAVINYNYVEMWNKGEIFWKTDRKSSPIVADPIGPMRNDSKMVYIWLTTYTTNTFFHQAHAHDHFNDVINKTNVYRDQAPFLKTNNCSDACIGTIFPRIGEDYPDSEIELHLKTASTPRAVVIQKAVLFQIEFTVDMRARRTDNNVSSLLTLLMNTSLTTSARIEDRKLKGSIIDHSFNLTVTDTPIGDIHLPSLFHGLLDSVLDRLVVPKANAFLLKGVDLPVLNDVRFYNTELFLHEGNFLIGSDFKF